MTKTLTYSGLAIFGLLVILTFVTARTFTQLTIGILLYPILAYLILKLIPGKVRPSVSSIPMQTMSKKKAEEVRRQKVEVADIDKRTFLKLVGTAGISFFIFSLLGRRVESLLFGKAIESGVTGLAAREGDRIDSTSASITQGYKITEIDDGEITYYGFTNKDGGWLIMKEGLDSSSFRYSKGDFGFPAGWANRENLKYDYFYNLF